MLNVQRYSLLHRKVKSFPLTRSITDRWTDNYKHDAMASVVGDCGMDDYV